MCVFQKIAANKQEKREHKTDFSFIFFMKIKKNYTHKNIRKFINKRKVQCMW